MSKPCPTTWKSALIFISEGFWRAEILGGGEWENCWAGNKRRAMKEHACVLERKIFSVFVGESTLVYCMRK